MSESGTGIRALDEVARRLVEDAAAADQRRGRGIRVRGPLHLLPRFLAGALVAATLIAGFVVLVGGAGDARREPVPGSAAGELGPGEYWYVRIRRAYEGRPLEITETWTAADGSGRTRVVRGGRTVPSADRADAPRLGSRRLSYEDILALPADPARLRPLLRSDAPAAGGLGVMLAATRLFEGPYPLPQNLRSALLNTIGAEPDVHRSAQVRDVRGRLGRAFITAAGPRGTGEMRIVFDPRTAQMLALEQRQGRRLKVAETIERSGIVKSTRARPPDIDQRLLDNFAVFRRAQRPGDIPNRRETGLGGLAGEFDRSLGRRVGVLEGRPVYVLPGPAVVCLTGGGGCTDIDFAVRGKGPVGISQGCRQRPGGGLESGSVRIVALLPDHAVNVRVRRRDGSEITAYVRDNVLLADLATEPESVTPTTIVWDGPKGHDATTLGGVAAQTC